MRHAAYLEVILALFGVLAGGVGGAMLDRILHRARLRSPFVRATGIAKPHRTIIVVPRRTPTVDVLHSVRNHVTLEDMLAVNYVERVLTLAGLEDGRIEIQSVPHLDRSVAYDSHLVLICSPKANRYTADVLAGLNRHRMSVNRAGFATRLDDPDEWHIVFGGAKYESPSYEQEAGFLQAGLSTDLWKLEDYALLGRWPNPMNEERKVIVVAGIRGIGTWGAARFLRDKPEEILERSNGDDFACVVHVTYANLKIVKTELTPSFMLL